MSGTAPILEARRDGDVLVLRMANPPVNALGHALRSALLAAIGNLGDAKAVVLSGAGRMFSGGADMTEFGKPRREPSTPALIDAIEALPVPVVAALHGAALGGGLELALGCHARVAAPGTTLALPEVLRGLLPGAGGTQRLPRLVGIGRATEAVVSGAPIPADEALALGLLDVVDADPEAGAIALARAGAAPRRTRDLPVAGDAAAAGAAAAPLLKRARGQEAPAVAAATVAAALDLPFAEGMARERAAFLGLMEGAQSRALRHVFFAEREAQKPAGVPAGTEAAPVRRAVVIGAGTMGGGIAMCFANAGIPVTMVDRDPDGLARGLERCRANWRRSVEGGKLAPAEMERRAGLLAGATDLAAVGQADAVVEAVFEKMALKEEIFAELDRLARPGALLATNTSTLDVDRIAAATRRPRDVLGLHFFSPANVMRLLEIVRGRETSAAALATGVALGRTLGKLPVVVGNCDGFVGNRMLHKRGLEGERLLQEGALPWQVDRVLTRFGMAMGPFAVGDLAGLDIGAAIRRERGTTAPVADALVAAGRLGQKTAAGYYRYAPGARTGEPDAEVERIVVETSARLGIARRPVGDDEILDRMLLPLVNEGARILEEGIAARAGDIDAIWVNGYGWPAWRGGPMWHAGEIGLAAVRDRLAAMAERSGDPGLRPAPLIERLAASGGRFGDAAEAVRAA